MKLEQIRMEITFTIDEPLTYAHWQTILDPLREALKLVPQIARTKVTVHEESAG